MKLDALVMAGGKGERFAAGEKPLARFRGRPLVEHVLRALEESKSIGSIIVVTSPWTSKTAVALRKKWKTFPAPGEGYVKDMLYALKALGLGKTLVVAADLPLIQPRIIDYIVKKYSEQEEPAMAVMVPFELCKKLGLTPTMVRGNLVPAGVNVVDGKELNGPERVLVVDNQRLAFNVNTLEDLSSFEANAFNIASEYDTHEV